VPLRRQTTPSTRPPFPPRRTASASFPTQRRRDLEPTFSADTAPYHASPLWYRRQLQERYQLESNRSIPDWGRAIFSPFCVIMRPTSAEDLGRFLKYALALTRVHTEVCGL
jgi:hypothetical protein